MVCDRNFVCYNMCIKTEKKMNADILFQITAIGVIVAVLNQLLIKSDHSEHALMVTIAGLIMVLVLIVGEIGKLFDALKMTFNI